MKILTPEEMATLTDHQWRALCKQGLTLTDEQAEIVRRAREPDVRIADMEAENAQLKAIVAGLRSERATLIEEKNDAESWWRVAASIPLDGYDKAAERWMEQEGIKRVINAVSSVFDRWADEDILVRFRDKLNRTIQLAFVEGAIAGVGSCSAENARLSLDLQAAECLHESAYKAGVGAGWNLGVAGDEAGFARARDGTEYLAELKRIKAALEALKGAA